MGRGRDEPAADGPERAVEPHLSECRGAAAKCFLTSKVVMRGCKRAGRQLPAQARTTSMASLTVPEHSHEVDIIPASLLEREAELTEHSKLRSPVAQILA